MTKKEEWTRFYASLGLLLIYLPVPVMAGLALRPSWLGAPILGVPAALWGVGAMIALFVLFAFMAANRSEHS